METSVSRPHFTLSILEILDRTFRIYRENVVGLLTLSTLAIVPITLLNVFIGEQTNPFMADVGRFTPSADRSLLVCGLSLMSIIASILQFVLTYGPITYLTSEYQMGRRITVGEAFRGAQDRFTTLGCGFLLLVVLLSMFFGFIIIALRLTDFTPLIAIAGIFVYYASAVSAQLSPAAVLEPTSITSTINRAFALGKARFWKMAGVSLAVLLIIWVISIAFTAMGSLFVSGGFVGLTQNVLAFQVINVIYAILVAPIIPIAMTVLYYDVRTRTEGLDLALRALDDPDARPGSVPAPYGRAGYTRQDWINILIITVVSVVVLLVAGAAVQATIQQFFPQLGQFQPPR